MRIKTPGISTSIKQNIKVQSDFLSNNSKDNNQHNEMFKMLMKSDNFKQFLRDNKLCIKCQLDIIDVVNYNK